MANRVCGAWRESTKPLEISLTLSPFYGGARPELSDEDKCGVHRHTPVHTALTGLHRAQVHRMAMGPVSVTRTRPSWFMHQRSKSSPTPSCIQGGDSGETRVKRGGERTSLGLRSAGTYKPTNQNAIDVRKTKELRMLDANLPIAIVVFSPSATLKMRIEKVGNSAPSARCEECEA